VNDHRNSQERARFRQDRWRMLEKSCLKKQLRRLGAVEGKCRRHFSGETLAEWLERTRDC
jgi:hypothetical protein